MTTVTTMTTRVTIRTTTKALLKFHIFQLIWLKMFMGSSWKMSRVMKMMVETTMKTQVIREVAFITWFALLKMTLCGEKKASPSLLRTVKKCFNPP